MINDTHQGGDCAKKNYRPSAAFRVGRNAEEEKLHQMSCAYWASDAARKLMGLPKLETIRAATVSINKVDGVAAAKTEARKSWKGAQEARNVRKAKVYLQVLPVDHPMTPITRMVAEELNLPWEKLFAGGRAEPIIFARYVAMVLTMERRRWSRLQIANYFGRKDPELPTRAVRVLRYREKTDYKLRLQMAELRKKSENVLLS